MAHKFVKREDLVLTCLTCREGTGYHNPALICTTNCGAVYHDNPECLGSASSCSLFEADREDLLFSSAPSSSAPSGDIKLTASTALHLHVYSGEIDLDRMLCESLWVGKGPESSENNGDSGCSEKDGFGERGFVEWTVEGVASPVKAELIVTSGLPMGRVIEKTDLFLLSEEAGGAQLRKRIEEERFDRVPGFLVVPRDSFLGAAVRAEIRRLLAEVDTDWLVTGQAAEGLFPAEHRGASGGGGGGGGGGGALSIAMRPAAVMVVALSRLAMISLPSSIQSGAQMMSSILPGGLLNPVNLVMGAVGATVGAIGGVVMATPTIAADAYTIMTEGKMIVDTVPGPGGKVVLEAAQMMGVKQAQN